MSSRSARDAKHYANENLLHGLQVLEALEDTLKEPITMQRVAERTKLPYDKVRRCLLTLKLKGWAAQNEQGLWTLGSKLMRFGANYNDVILTAAKF